MSQALCRTAILAGLLTLTGCATLPGTYAGERAPEVRVPGGQIITQADITRTGARDAFQAIQRGRTHLLIADPGGGKPVNISHRGADSIAMASTVLLVVDGSRVKNPHQMLRNIPAESILFIQILSSREAALQWGSEAGNGVILVQTSAR